MKKWDVFISHAFEDKDMIARPIANALSGLGIEVWFDEFCFAAGDNIRAKMDEGLANSRYGIVILSKNFMEKYWTNYEMDGLLTFDSIDNDMRIIPIWHNIEKCDLAKYSPSLVMRYGLFSSMEFNKLVLSILQKVNPDLCTEVQRRKLVSDTHKKVMEVQYVDSRTLLDGPRIKEKLPIELLTRLTLVYVSIGKYHKSSYDEWIDGFLRDLNPSQETHIWENIALIFNQAASYLDSKREADLEHLFLYCANIYNNEPEERSEYINNLDVKFSIPIKKGYRNLNAMNQYIDKNYKDFSQETVKKL